MNDITRSQKWDHLTRPRVDYLDGLLGVPKPCLDHGFIRVVDYMGDESSIVQAARVSYGKGTKTASDDIGLLRYLMRHHHSTPFEMNELKVHMKLPLFVARQWIRHRTASVNEYSARYSILANEFYVPDVDDISPQSKTNKQGREGDLPLEVRLAMKATIDHHGAGAYQLYEELLTAWPWINEDGRQYLIPGGMGEAIPGREPHKAELGMARELARMVLPVNAYTEWYWKIDLHNLLHLLRLRVDPHAQAEIRAYANVLAEIVKGWVPNVWAAFEEYQLYAVTLSRTEADILRTIVSRNTGAFRKLVEESGFSAGEQREILAKMGG